MQPSKSLTDSSITATATATANDRTFTFIFSALVAGGAWLVARFVSEPFLFVAGAFGFFVLGFLLGAMELVSRWKVFIGLVGFGYFFGTWEYFHHPNGWVQAMAVVGSGVIFFPSFVAGAHIRYVAEAQQLIQSNE